MPQIEHYERMSALNDWTNNHLQSLSMSYSTGDIEGMRGTGKLAVDGALTFVPMLGTTKLSKLNKIDDLVDIAHGVDAAKTADMLNDIIRRTPTHEIPKYITTLKDTTNFQYERTKIIFYCRCLMIKRSPQLVPKKWLIY